MPRRRDPERIYQAQRAGIFARLRDEERVNEMDVEHLIARWEREAELLAESVDLSAIEMTPGSRRSGRLRRMGAAA